MITGTVVSEELIWVEGKVIALMSNGVERVFTCWKQVEQRDLDSYGTFGWRFKTAEQLIEMCRSINWEHQNECRHALHLDKVRRLGWDYAQRGY